LPLRYSFGDQRSILYKIPVKYLSLPPIKEEPPFLFLLKKEESKIGEVPPLW